MSSNTTMIKSAHIDYSILVGKKITIITEQFPGQVLTSRIMSNSNNNLVLDKSGSEGKINQLIPKQNVEMQFKYKGQDIAFTSSIIISESGRILVPIVASMSPTVRRKFIRFEMEKAVRLTYFDERNIKSARLNKLKWFETTISNIGGGGALAFMPSMLADDNFILMNMILDGLAFPSLVLGRVCHIHRNGQNKIVAGVEFITKENAATMISSSMVRNLPEATFQFDNKMAKELVEYLEKNYRNNDE